MNSMVIREAVPEDKPRMLAISAGIWGGYDYVPHVADYWLSGQGGTTLGVLVDGELMGFARLTVLSPDTCWLEGIRVDEAARGLGLGKALTEAMVKLAKEKGYVHIELSSFIENFESLCIVKKKGFAEKASFKYLEWMGEKPYSGKGVPTVIARQLPSALLLDEEALDALFERIMTSEGLANRQGYFSYDWTFKAFEQEDIKALIAMGGLYELTAEFDSAQGISLPQTCLMALSQRFAKGNYETLHWVEHGGYVGASLLIGLERAKALGQSFNSMLPAKELPTAYTVEGLEALSEATEDVFVFYYK